MDRGKVTEKGCYTISTRINKRLRQLSDETGESQSDLIGKALDFYLDLRDMEKIALELEDLNEKQREKLILS